MRINSVATRLTISTGMAKPMPADAPHPETIALFTPISRPALSSNGPPEFPGLMGGVGLDHALDLVGGIGRQPAAERADDSMG